MTRLLTALLIALLPASAFAGKTLDEAQAAFDSLAVDEAQPLFEKALGEPATREERIKAWKGLGLSLAFMADSKGAQDAFERLLLIDPEAKVDTALGPRVTKPFEAAKKAMRGKRAALKVERLPKTGEVRATLSDPMGLTSELRLFYRLHGKKSFELVKGTTDVKASPPADKDVEAYVQAVDPQGGVLFEDGTEAKFNSLPAVVRTIPENKTPDAVASAVKDAKKKSGSRPADEEPAVIEEEDGSEGGGSALPLYIGAAVVVVGGGVAAGYLLSRPPELTLTPADRTAQLPWRF